MNKNKVIYGISIIILLFVLLIIIVLLLRFSKNICKFPEGWAGRSGFSYNKNIPIGMLYADIKDRPSSNNIVDKQDLLNTMFVESKDTNVGIKIYADGWFKNFICKSNNEIPQVIEYYKFGGRCYNYSINDFERFLLDERRGILVGSGGSRRAIICDDKYVVEDFNVAYGPRTYGPFDVPK